jgi:hypothetical protein
MKTFQGLLLLNLCLVGDLAGQWTEKMDSLAKVTEAKYDLPPGTCKAFSLQESNHQRYAERVEANYVMGNRSYARRVRYEALAFSKANGGLPSYLTEVYQRGKSVTQFQIMGINVRALGYKGKYLSEIRLHEAFELFGRFVVGLKRRWPDRSDWIAAYNAGSPRKKNGRYVNQSYVQCVLRYIKQFAE